MPSYLLTRCVTLGELLNLSASVFSLWNWDNNNIYLIGLLLVWEVSRLRRLKHLGQPLPQSTQDRRVSDGHRVFYGFRELQCPFCQHTRMLCMCWWWHFVLIQLVLRNCMCPFKTPSFPGRASGKYSFPFLHRWEKDSPQAETEVTQ